MKKIITLIISVCLVLGSFAGTAFAEEAQEEPVELVFFAAASMTETMNQIAELYKEVAPNVTLVYNFDSSGTLKTQIQEGADCDIFISASPKQMNALDAAKDAEGGNEEGLDFVLSDTRIDLLENKVALAVPEGNPKGIESYDDLVAMLKEGSVLLSMGNSDVPVGQYTQKILAYYELNEEELANAGCITYGTNVKEVTTQVSEGTVDCGIIYATDAFSAGLTVVDTATKEMCGQVIYPAAVLNITKNEEAAKAFLEYLTTDEASAVFEAVGFTPIKAEEEVPAEEVPAEEAAADGEVAYTQQKVFDGTYGFGDAEITVKTNDDMTAFDITFVCFDEDQELIGTITNGICMVSYDETGFVAGDCQQIWDDACASENAWEPIQ